MIRASGVVLRRSLVAACGDGRSLDRSLRSSARTPGLPRPIARALARTAEAVDSGFRLSAALAAEGVLEKHEIALLRAAERSGAVPEALATIAGDAEHSVAAGRERRLRLAGSLVTSVVLWIVLVFLLTEVVPPFRSLADTFGPESLSGSAWLLRILAAHSRSTAAFVAAAPVLGAVLLLLAKVPGLSRWRRRASLRRPVPAHTLLLGWSRFARIAAMALRAGVPLHEARLLARAGVSDARLRLALRRAATRSPYGIDSLLAPFGFTEVLSPTADAADVASELEALAAEADARRRFLSTLRDVKVSTGILLAAGAGAFAAAWLLLVPFLELAGKDPF